MKGQSLIIQFVLFFLIGFSLFVSIGSFFRYQSDLFKEGILSSSLSLANSYMSSNIIALIDGCKQCDYINLSVSMANFSAGYTLEFNLTNYGLNVSVPYKYYFSQLHNLNSSFTFSGNSSTGKTITIIYENFNI